MQKKTTFILIIIFAIIAALGGIGYLVVQDRFGGHRLLHAHPKRRQERRS